MNGKPWEHVVSVSGGKDSTALYLKAIERGRPFRAVFADTGHEHEVTYDFVRQLPALTGGPAIEWVRQDFTDRINKRRGYIAENWPKQGIQSEKINRALDCMRPTGNPFLDLCMLKGRFPSAKARFCTEELKVLPLFEQIQLPILRANRTVISWQGIRAEESFSRSLLSKWQRLEPARGIKLSGEEIVRFRIYAYRPLLDWSIEDVWAMHRRHGIKPNPLYSQGMTRVGCMPCIMCRKSELYEIAKRFPDHVERVAEWERIVSDVSKRGFATFFPASDDPAFVYGNEISVEGNGIKSSIEWSKTDRGGRQYNLLTAIDFNTACDEWGACEHV